MPALIVVGDRTSHGGTVIAGSSMTDTHGKQIARVGDRVTCPLKGHGGVTVIVTGDPTLIIDGKPAARHGDKTACGASLIASQMATTDDPGAGSSPGSAAAAAAALARSLIFDEQTHLVATAIEGIPYFIETRDGRTFSGRLDARGLLSRIDTEKQDEYIVYWGDEALTKMEGKAG